MMKTKIAAKYIYVGFGFPVKLHDVEKVKIGKEWAPKIDVRKVARHVMKELPFQASRLTGAQIRFVREYLGMSLRDFASKVVHQSHMAVSKWEKFEQKPTNMDAATEVVLRLFVFHEAVGKKANIEKKFMKAYETISSMNFKNVGAKALSF
jgi:DNA-binding transcriptional regulator YiaG